jgi:adenylyl-sulfate kinase
VSRGFVLWFTGLSGSGKSTLTAMTAAELRRRGIHVETLDGDEVRRHLSKGLGFSREDRDANIRRIGFVARLVARSGGCAIAAAISPYREIRNEIRAGTDRFCEVYTECPIDVLAERDPKGLYRKALAGEIKNFTGVDDPYQAPEAPEVHLHTDRESPEQSVARIVGRLEELGFIAAGPDITSSAPVATDSWQGLCAPHGADLPDRLLRGDLAAHARHDAAGAPSVILDEEALGELSALSNGLLAPHKGFVTSKDHLRILDAMRLETGLPWAAPVTLRVPVEREPELRGAERLALRDPSGTLLGVVSVSDLWQPDLQREAEALFGTTAPEHPDVARLMARGGLAVGGDVECFCVTAPPTLGPTPDPREIRLALRRTGAAKVFAFVAASAPDHAAEYLVRAALELSDAAIALVPWAPDDEPSAARKAEAWRALFTTYFPAQRGLVVAFPELRGLSAARRRLHEAIVAQNLGAHRLLVPETEAQIPHAGELAIRIEATAAVGWSERAGQAASLRSAPDAILDDPRIRGRRPEVEAALGQS